jgi:nicotinate-nucleotide adenylyltransferase
VGELRLGVLGGTFDPIHGGHLILGEEARVQLKLDRVLFLPAGDPWRKAGKRISPAEHRLAMTEIAIADNPYFAASRIEIDRSGPTYTADTLAQLHQDQATATEIFFILGYDALVDLPHWHNPPSILAQAQLALANRPDSPPDEALEAQIIALGGTIDHLDMPLIAISATRLRERLALGLSVRYQVPDNVLDYITQHQLYAGEATSSK